MRLLHWLPALLLGFPVVALAQPETIRGRITSDSGRVISAATVFVTRGPDRLVQTVATNDSGRYTVTFDPGTGDYLVAVQAAGFKGARRRITRVGNEREYTADFVLSGNVTSLDAVQVTANQPVRATTAVNPYTQETGSAEAWRQGASAGLPPSVAGDISTTVSTIPGVVMGPGGPSMLGASGTSNLTTLNGMAMGASSVPRAARVETRVTGATYDATRGGFSGANIDLRLSGGSRDSQNRNLFFTGDMRALQATDAVGRALGATNQMWRASGGIDGEAIRGVMTYNISVDASRTDRALVDITGADALAYERSGVALDSVQRARQVAQGLGLRLRPSGIPTAVRRDGFGVMARFDDTRDTSRTRFLTVYANQSENDNEGLSALMAPGAGAARRERAAGAMLSLGRWSGPAFSTVQTTRFNVGMVNNRTTPYLQQPALDVLVRTTGSTDATDAGIASLSLGGRGSELLDNTRWTAEANHEFMRNIHGRQHQLRAIAWARYDGLTQQGGANGVGRYTYASLDDLAANRPMSYSRTLLNPEREGQVWNSAVALSHTWAPSRFFSLIYGARVEGNGALGGPARNEALENALGIRTGGVAPRVHVSPRVGFTYAFNKARDNGSGMSGTPFGTWFRYPTGVLRGGIGEFRDLWRPDVLADAAARTGLPGSVLSLNCVGAAVPLPSWSATDAPLPTQCADGGGPLGERAPSVSVLSRNFDVPRSWRASLDYNTSRFTMVFRASALATLDLNQPSLVDRNFAGVSRFTLANEGGRTVFVSPSAIDAATGALSPAEARRTSAYSRVDMLTSDLRGRGGQVTFSAGLDRFNRKWRGWPFMTVNYTVQRIDRQQRGFDGATFADPAAVEWAPSFADARHVWLLQFGRGGRLGNFSAFARLQSGLPFTPLVQADVNGDGRGGDRAWVPDPATTSDAALASGLRGLLESGSPVARACLLATMGRSDTRQACRGPWTRTLSVSWALPINYGATNWRNRVNVTLFANNVLSGVDQLLHGENMRGWGGVSTPDATLLVPRGFDASARAFRYDVNPRFAETRPARLSWRDPFRVTLDISLRLHTDYDLQALRRAIEPVRMSGRWERRGEDSLVSRYLRETSSIHKVLVEEADTLFLLPPQIDKLRQRDSVFSEQVRELYRPLAQFLAAQPEGVASKQALDSVKTVQKAYWELFWKQPEIAAEVLDPQQMDVITLLKDMLTVPAPQRKQSRYFFGRSITLKHTVPQVRK
ncbi:MAG TPA: carboxypeptidase-like regulatory domain-containing protein [Gemmatimonas sp.]|uniref:carboxypeptidase-like regulatory domain-containing protein n=1 Tax=Gemmatimonas sp. TaxID=1962908 RepID=UPI002ED9FA54